MGKSAVTSPIDQYPVLTELIERADGPPIADHAELSRFVSAEAVRALSDIILHHGKQRRGPEGQAIHILTVKRGREKIQGTVEARTDGQNSVYLGLYKRGLTRFRRKQWVQLSPEGADGFSAADDREGFYLATETTDEYIDTYANKLGTQVFGYSEGETQGTTTGYEMAGEAIRNRDKTLNGFFRVTSGLTKKLVTVS